MLYVCSDFSVFFFVLIIKLIRYTNFEYKVSAFWHEWWKVAIFATSRCLMAHPNKSKSFFAPKKYNETKSQQHKQRNSSTTISAIVMYSILDCHRECYIINLIYKNQHNEAYYAVHILEVFWGFNSKKEWRIFILKKYFEFLITF